jgi:hypothetical protein
MSPRRLIVHAVLIALVSSLGACQSPFPRACLQSKDCEHHPVNGASAGVLLNGPSALHGVNGPLVLGGERSVR